MFYKRTYHVCALTNIQIPTLSCQRARWTLPAGEIHSGYIQYWREYPRRPEWFSSDIYIALCYSGDDVHALSGLSPMSAIGCLNRGLLVKVGAEAVYCTQIAQLCRRRHVIGRLLNNGNVLGTGTHCDYSGCGAMTTTTCFLDATSINSWSVTGRMNSARVHHTATLLPSGKVLAAGGYVSAGAPIVTAELYTP
jgi:hypothetical protein